jgi:hypothetical protein
MRRLLLAALTIATSGALASAAPSLAAGGSAQANPNLAGGGAHVLVDVQGADGGLRPGKIPSSLAIGLQKGYVVNPDAVAGICTDDQAGKQECPANSIIGTGTFDLHAAGFAFGPNGQDFTAQLTFFRANPRQPGDPMGVVFAFREPSSGFHGSSIGRLTMLADPVLGPQLLFDPLPIPKLPSGFTFTLKRMRIDLGAGAATPPVRVKKAKKRKHRCKRVTRRTKSGKKKTVFVCPKKKKASRKKASTRRAVARQATDGPALLTNPVDCTGTWRVQVRFGYGSENETRDLDAACTARR